jgi:hypothetical protein
VRPVRALLATAALAVVAVSVPSAVADATPVLDGKVVKNLHAIAEAAPGAAAVDPTPDQVASCAPPACARITFVYKPAASMKSAALSVREANFWAALGDEDLYLMQGKTVVASCTGTVSNQRYLAVPASALKPGTTYTAVEFFSHEIGESTSINVDLPAAAPRAAQYVDPNDPFQTSFTMCGT